jgi:hypothetical protein
MKPSAGINAPAAKTQQPARFSATAFINKANPWIVAWQLLIRRRMFGEVVGGRELN